MSTSEWAGANLLFKLNPSAQCLVLGKLKTKGFNLLMLLMEASGGYCATLSSSDPDRQSEWQPYTWALTWADITQMAPAVQWGQALAVVL
jgi:hypothetical protein